MPALPFPFLPKSGPGLYRIRVMHFHPGGLSLNYSGSMTGTCMVIIPKFSSSGKLLSWLSHLKGMALVEIITRWSGYAGYRHFIQDPLLYIVLYHCKRLLIVFIQTGVFTDQHKLTEIEGCFCDIHTIIYIERTR